MRGRMYDPVQARFLTPDPFVANPWDSQALNRYSYGLNNPITFADPSGLLSQDISLDAAPDQLGAPSNDGLMTMIFTDSNGAVAASESVPCEGDCGTTVTVELASPQIADDNGTRTGDAHFASAWVAPAPQGVEGSRQQPNQGRSPFPGGPDNTYAQAVPGLPLGTYDRPGHDGETVKMLLDHPGVALAGVGAAAVTLGGFAALPWLMRVFAWLAPAAAGTVPTVAAAGAAGAKIGQALVGQMGGKMASIVQQVTNMGLPQAQAAAATNAAVNALGLRTVVVDVGANTVVSSVQLGAGMPVLIVQATGAVVQGVADLAVQGSQFVISNLRGF
jgi:hypothetical protein